MSEKRDISEAADSGDSIESADYDDDFEKDLEWLINEEGKEILDDTQKGKVTWETYEVPPRILYDWAVQNLALREAQNTICTVTIRGVEVLGKKQKNHGDNEEDTETSIDKISEDREGRNSSKESLEEVLKVEGSQHNISVITDTKQLVSQHNTKQLEQTSDSDSEGSFQGAKLENQDDLEEDDEDIKRYILEKIEEANKLLLSQEPLDETKERKLKFKDDLVDLEVPPLNAIKANKNGLQGERDISGRLSQLHLSSNPEDLALSINGTTDDEHKDAKILVERDGKFELLSIHDIESQGFFPPLSVSFSDIEAQRISPKASFTTSFGTLCLTKEESVLQPSCSPSRDGIFCFPQPPPIRPSSAINITTVERGKSPRRVQSANIGIRSSTYCLSPRQKELQKQMEQRREKLKKEEELRKRIQEEQKRRENDTVFKAWLQKKKGQMQEEKRIQRAKQLEDFNSRQESRNPEEAFRSWLRKKQEEQMKEKEVQNLKDREECVLFLPRTVENDKAYKQWLRKKRREKRAEQLAAKERSRQLRQEARRAKQIENILYSISEPKSLRFTDS